MAPPATPQIDYEQELKIVRKFLRRNNIDDLMLALSPWGSPYQAVRVVGYAGDIPNNILPATKVGFSVDTDPRGFLQVAQPDRLTVPEGLGGQYFIHAEIRWLKADPRIDFDLADRDAGRFYSHLRLNDDVGPVESSRATNIAVPFASGTTQQCTAEIHLNPADFLELRVNQTVHDRLQVNAWLTMRRVGP